MMCGWSRQECPNSKCGKRFRMIQDAPSPDTASAADFFDFVNRTRTGRVTKEELRDWYTTNFSLAAEDAAGMVDGNWHFWDVPKDRPFLEGGWLRSKDQGDLDRGEFLPVQEFMKESLARSRAPTTAAPAPALPAAPAAPCGPAPAAHDGTPAGRGQKRPSADADAFAEGLMRNVAQKKLRESEELQRQLSNDLDRGREWFNHFDFNGSGQLERGELITALLQTLMGNRQVSREQITSIVSGIWDAVDSDGTGSVSFGEFQLLREAVTAQLRHDAAAGACSA